jgi:hypothetical protein
MGLGGGRRGGEGTGTQHHSHLSLSPILTDDIQYTQIKKRQQIKKRPCTVYYMHILYTYIANIKLIASTPQPRHGQFHCWWRFPVFSQVPFTNFQLKVPYYFLQASGLTYLPPNISEKFISSIVYKSTNNCLLNDTLSTPPVCSYVIWTPERKKEANPTFRSCAIQILKAAQFWRGVAFLFAYTVFDSIKPALKLEGALL